MCTPNFNGNFSAAPGLPGIFVPPLRLVGEQTILCSIPRLSRALNQTSQEEPRRHSQLHLYERRLRVLAMRARYHVLFRLWRARRCQRLRRSFRQLP